jgi:hypothetical protein
MTITETAKQKTQPSLGPVVKKLINDRVCLSLLRFFVAHPNGRFSKLAIVHAIDDSNSRTEIERDLAQMVDEGILMITIENDISFYLLTREECARQTILEMGEFDWRHWQLVLEHL